MYLGNDVFWKRCILEKMYLGKEDTHARMHARDGENVEAVDILGVERRVVREDAEDPFRLLLEERHVAVEAGRQQHDVDRSSHRDRLLSADPVRACERVCEHTRACMGESMFCMGSTGTSECARVRACGVFVAYVRGMRAATQGSMRGIGHNYIAKEYA